MAIDTLSTTRAKAADTPNARGAPPIPTFDTGKMFSQMLDQTFASRDTARQQAAARGQAPARDDTRSATAKPDDTAPRPAAARATKERPAVATRRRDDDEDDDVAVEARPRAKDDDDKAVDGDKEVAAKTDDKPTDDGGKQAQDQAGQAAAQAATQAAVAVAAPVVVPSKVEAKADGDAAADEAAAALAARSAQTAAAAMTAQATQDDKPADAMAAALQAMTPQQMTEVANIAAPAAKTAKTAADGIRDTFSKAEAALADLLADIGGGSIVSASSGSGTGAGTGGQHGGGLLDGAAWSLMQQTPGAASTGTTQAMTFAGLMQAGLSAMAEGDGDAAAAAPAAAAVEATATTTGAIPLPAGGMAGIDGPDTPQAPAQPQAARPTLPLPVADQVAAHLGKAVKDEVKAINVQLNPEELGRVDIRLEFGADGKVSAHVTADNQQALDLLQRDQRSLERSLTDAGLKTDNSSLSFSLRNDGSGGDFNRFAQNQGGGQQGGQGQNRGGRGGAVADVTGIDATPAARPRMIAADGALDIKV